jgi:histone H3/H4
VPNTNLTLADLAARIGELQDRLTDLTIQRLTFRFALRHEIEGGASPAVVELIQTAIDSITTEIATTQNEAAGLEENIDRFLSRLLRSMAHDGVQLVDLHSVRVR